MSLWIRSRVQDHLQECLDIHRYGLSLCLFGVASWVYCPAIRIIRLIIVIICLFMGFGLYFWVKALGFIDVFVHLLQVIQPI